MSAHTPGPWIVGNDPELDPDGAGEWFSIWTDVPGAANAELAGRIGVEANAHLIAAAPDLLDAVSFALSHLQADYGNNREDARAEADLIAALTAAIEKAEGVAE